MELLRLRLQHAEEQIRDRDRLLDERAEVVAGLKLSVRLLQHQLEQRPGNDLNGHARPSSGQDQPAEGRLFPEASANVSPATADTEAPQIAVDAMADTRPPADALTPTRTSRPTGPEVSAGAAVDGKPAWWRRLFGPHGT
jgi:hypothetical protein